MKILLINDFYLKGGTEIQSHREIELYKKNNIEIFFLTFDMNYPLKKDEYWINIPEKQNNVKKVLNLLWKKNMLYKKIKKEISKIQPDYIHINNVIFAPNQVFDIVKDYKVVQTIRDYAAVCPKATCIYGNNSECEGYCYKNCKAICKDSNILKRWRIKKINKLRIKSVDRFIAPSIALAKKCTENGMNTICLNNPFDFSNENHLKNNCRIKNYLYYGLISDMKGVTILIKQFKQFMKDKDVKLYLIGSVEKKYSECFYKLINNCHQIEYLGPMSWKDVMNFYSDVYCVIVPSLWIENYPNTVLESIANKTLVIGSNRGGIPELISNKNQLFDIQNSTDLVRCLNWSYYLDESEYISIVTKRYNYIRSNNSQINYFKNLMNIYKTIK